jgi:hypothetical protein
VAGRALRRDHCRRLRLQPRQGVSRRYDPLSPRTACAIDLAIDERVEGPIVLTLAGQRPDRHGAARVVRRVARRAGMIKPVGPQPLRHAFVTALDTGSPCAMSWKLPRTPTHGRPCAMTRPEPRWTGVCEAALAAAGGDPGLVASLLRGW